MQVDNFALQLCHRLMIYGSVDSTLLRVCAAKFLSTVKAKYTELKIGKFAGQYPNTASCQELWLRYYSSVANSIINWKWINHNKTSFIILEVSWVQNLLAFSLYLLIYAVESVLNCWISLPNSRTDLYSIHKRRRTHWEWKSFDKNGQTIQSLHQCIFAIWARFRMVPLSYGEIAWRATHSTS